MPTVRIIGGFIVISIDGGEVGLSPRGAQSLRDDIHRALIDISKPSSQTNWCAAGCGTECNCGEEVDYCD
jgi:hypothetical protein